MIGKAVVHESFGEGIINSIEGSIIWVQFASGVKRFEFPNAFIKNLKAKDKDVVEKISVLLKQEATRRIDLEKEKTREATARKAQDESLIVAKKERISTYKRFPREKIAFKCNFCDGGKTAEKIGFNGVCSDALIQSNINIDHHAWCSLEESPCRHYLDGKINRKELEAYMSNEGGFVCYESAMLRDWRASAGVNQTGETIGRRRRLMKVQPNSLAVLTTREPNSQETSRFIFAVFLIDETFEGDNREEGFVTTKSEFKIQLTLEEARGIKYWNYYANPNAPDVIRLGQGLYRYLLNEQAAQILQDVASVKKNTNDEQLANKFFHHFCRISDINPETLTKPHGALVQ